MRIETYKTYYLVWLDENDIIPAIEYGKICDSGNKTTSQYTRGMINPNVSAKELANAIESNKWNVYTLLQVPSIVGKLSEIAFGGIVGQTPDLKHRVNGDDSDFTINGKTIDVKCTTDRKTSIADGKRCYLRVVNEHGKQVKWQKDYYVVSYIRPTKPREFQIVFTGYYTLKDVQLVELVNSMYSTHMNKVLELRYARNLNELLTYR